VSFGIVFHTIWQWVLREARERGTSLDTLSHNYGTPIVGETADWILNDVHNSALEAENVMQAFENAKTQEEVEEGQNGGGAGMTCHMFPGGTGTSSRVVNGKYTVGVLVQSNYGNTHDLQIGGVPIGKLLLKDNPDYLKVKPDAFSGKADDGSIVIILM
jgi:D-aminopeptidase